MEHTDQGVCRLTRHILKDRGGVGMKGVQRFVDSAVVVVVEPRNSSRYRQQPGEGSRCRCRTIDMHLCSCQPALLDLVTARPYLLFNTARHGAPQPPVLPEDSNWLVWAPALTSNTRAIEDVGGEWHRRALPQAVRASEMQGTIPYGVNAAS